MKVIKICIFYLSYMFVGLYYFCVIVRFGYFFYREGYLYSVCFFFFVDIIFGEEYVKWFLYCV